MSTQKEVLKGRIELLEKELKQSFNNEGLLAGVCNATNKWLIENHKYITAPKDSKAAGELAELLRCFSIILENYSFDTPAKAEEPAKAD